MSSRVLKKRRLDEARLKALDITRSGEVIGRLVPVGPWILHESELIGRISDWRNHASRMFLSQFQSTASSTKEYLSSYPVGQDSRMLFMIETEGIFIGHVGLANITKDSAEIDNLMRGETGGCPELIEESERTLVCWAFSNLGLDVLTLKILSFNIFAKSIHERVGFQTLRSIPLRKESSVEGVRLVECSEHESTVRFTYDVMEVHRGTFVALN